MTRRESSNWPRRTAHRNSTHQTARFSRSPQTDGPTTMGKRNHAQIAQLAWSQPSAPYTSTAPSVAAIVSAPRTFSHATHEFAGDTVRGARIGARRQQGAGLGRGRRPVRPGVRRLRAVPARVRPSTRLARSRTQSGRRATLRRTARTVNGPGFGVETPGGDCWGSCRGRADRMAGYAPAGQGARAV